MEDETSVFVPTGSTTSSRWRGFLLHRSECIQVRMMINFDGMENALSRQAHRSSFPDRRPRRATFGSCPYSVQRPQNPSVVDYALQSRTWHAAARPLSRLRTLSTGWPRFRAVAVRSRKPYDVIIPENLRDTHTNANENYEEYRRWMTGNGREENEYDTMCVDERGKTYVQEEGKGVKGRKGREEKDEVSVACQRADLNPT